MSNQSRTHRYVPYALWLLLAGSLPAAVAPQDVPAPNFAGKPVNYVSWYRNLLEPLGADNAYHTHEPYLSKPDETPSPTLLDLPEDASAQLDELLISPRRWRQEECPALASAIRQARPALQACREAADKKLFAVTPPARLPSLPDLVLPHLSYARQVSRLLLADGLSDQPQVAADPVEAMRLALRMAEQLGYPDVPMPLVQQRMAHQLRRSVYEVANEMLDRSLLDSRQIDRLHAALRATDNADLRHLLASSLSGEQAGAFGQAQHWVIPGSNRFTKWLMRRYLEEVVPTPDTSVIADATVDTTIDAVRRYWNSLYAVLREPTEADPVEPIVQAQDRVREASPFAAEFFCHSIERAVQEASQVESQRRQLRQRLALTPRQLPDRINAGPATGPSTQRSLRTSMPMTSQTPHSQPVPQ